MNVVIFFSPYSLTPIHLHTGSSTFYEKMLQQFAAHIHNSAEGQWVERGCPISPYWVEGGVTTWHEQLYSMKEMESFILHSSFALVTWLLLSPWVPTLKKPISLTVSPPRILPRSHRSASVSRLLATHLMFIRLWARVIVIREKNKVSAACSSSRTLTFYPQYSCTHLLPV